MICFMINDQLHKLDDVPSSTTVLQFLRETCNSKGTKEGCAAGDCGACTVAVADYTEDSPSLRAINACITPLASMHGKQVITVESLSDGENLHPVQESMVNYHGSQCGFCTPGIVMSLYALWANKAGTCESQEQAIEDIDQALAGNLCRCTGYQPIIKAAQSLLKPRQEISEEIREEDREESDAKTLLFKNTGIADELKHACQSERGTLIHQDNRFFSPTNRNELLNYLKEYPHARLVAGATDLGLEITQEFKSIKVLISTLRVKELLVYCEASDYFTVGAALNFEYLSSRLQQHYPEFMRLLDRLGSLQIRNQATLGGNIANASPIGDTPPVLIALDASVNIFGPSGERSIKLEKFFLAYRKTALCEGEFIESFCIPKLKADEHLKIYKVSKRFDDDISTVCMAMFLSFDGHKVRQIRIAFGGMSAIPTRAYTTEKDLIGDVFGEASVERAGQFLSQDFQPIDDVRSSSNYRLAMARNLLKRACLEINSGQGLQLCDGSYKYAP